MKKILNIFIAITAFLMIHSCNGNPFMNNLFSSFDEYEIPSSFDSTDDVLSEAGDDGFLDALAEDPELTERVIDLLDDVLSEDPAEANQEEALLLADVYLVTSGADDTLNNVTQLLEDPESMDFDEPEDLIVDIFVVDSTLSPVEQEASVSAQIDAFLNASDALEFYGDTMIAGQEPSGEVVPGVTAGSAMVAGMTGYMIENMVDSNGNDMSDEESKAALINTILYDMPMPDTAPNPAVDDAATTDDKINAMLGPGLSEVVSDGFDLSSFDEGGE